MNNDLRISNIIFDQSLETLNKIKSSAHRIYFALSVIRAAIIGIFVITLWTVVAPEHSLLHLVTGVITFFGLLGFSSLSRRHKISPNSFLVALDMQHPGTSTSPYNAAQSPNRPLEWEPRLAREIKRLKAWENRRLTNLAGSLVVPLLVTVLFISKTNFQLADALLDAKNVFSALTGGMTLEVVDGLVGQDPGNPPKYTFSLSSISPVSITLIPTNLLRLTFVRVGTSKTPPIIKLLAAPGTQPLTIQMSEGGNFQRRENLWTAEFSVAETSDLSLSEDGIRPLAHFVVNAPPTPKVQMTANLLEKKYWADQDYLSLNIHVSAVHPIDHIQLKIENGHKSHTETVLKISGVTTVVDTEYKLNFQPYMEEDVLEFDLMAEAIDRSEPTPLIGHSNAVHIKVASAYGRYHQILERLKTFKLTLDQGRSSNEPSQNFPRDSVATMTSALTESEETPFFDALDRASIAHLRSLVGEAAASPNLSKIQNLTDELGQFLLEHEILDDRERDRDFFIVIRSFSHVLESSNPDRTVQSKYLSARMLSFLDERMKKWTLRVNRLGSGHEPSAWGHIKKNIPFHQLVKTAEQNSSESPKLSQNTLSKLANDYRLWIEDLESKEDQLRQKQEQERQQGLANARNDLRELQQRQDSIATAMDRAGDRPAPDSAQKWTGARIHQNTNIKDSTSLLGKLRALAPNAGERLEYAIDAMNQAVINGEAGNWAQVETTVDRAGRLLRDAEQATQNNQGQRDRGRRKRTGGDDYHGTVIGGQIDIKREYEVNPRYREDILKDVESEYSTDENKNFLDGWLRQVVR